MFKIGDYVKINLNTTLDTGEIVNDWAGEIEAVYPKDKSCIVLLDASTIYKLEDVYIQRAMEEGVEPFLRVFDWENLTLAPRRNTDKEIMEALEHLSDRAIVLEEQMETERLALQDQWVAAFKESPLYASLTPFQKEETHLINSFMDMMYTYEYQHPYQWTSAAVQVICLEFAPSSITADIEVFENYGDILIAFINFLGCQDYIKNSAVLVEEIEQIKAQIPHEAQKSEHWNHSKTLLMGAKAAGVDISDQKAIEAYILAQQEANRQKEIKPTSVVALKKLGRNEKITVQYKDGTLLKAVKFKKVKSDLESGQCTLVEE